MSFGASTFGGGYFGGAAAISTGPEIITGTGACVLGALTCSGAGTVPSHGPQQTVWGLSGSLAIPLKKRKRIVRGVVSSHLPAVTCAVVAARLRKRRGLVAQSIAAPAMVAAGDVILREDDEFVLEYSRAGEQFGILLDSRWR